MMKVKVSSRIRNITKRDGTVNRRRFLSIVVVVSPKGYKFKLIGGLELVHERTYAHLQSDVILRHDALPAQKP